MWLGKLGCRCWDRGWGCIKKSSEGILSEMAPGKGSEPLPAPASEPWGPICHVLGAGYLPTEWTSNWDARVLRQPAQHKALKNTWISNFIFPMNNLLKTIPRENSPERFPKQWKLHFFAFLDFVADCRITKFAKSQGPGIISNFTYFDRLQLKPTQSAKFKTQSEGGDLVFIHSLLLIYGNPSHNEMKPTKDQHRVKLLPSIISEPAEFQLHIYIYTHPALRLLC